MKILALACFITAFWRATGSSPDADTTLTDVGGADTQSHFGHIIVNTPLGDIEGVTSTINQVPVHMFLGIPYAQPPLGNLRFKGPQLVRPWDHVLQAKKHPPACMQHTEGPFPWYDDMPGKSEDCLYMNIYAPFYATKGSKLAVMFWIHGGGFTLGSNRMDVYDGRALADSEGVIVVTVNYRLGLFGFLNSNAEDAPGNAGLWDIVVALQWVNDFIEYFGGDKDRITIFGESGGAAAVGMLCVSPVTSDLFSRAILQSASVTRRIYNSVNSNLLMAQGLAEAVDCAKAADNFTINNRPTEVIQCLRNRDATLLIQTFSSFKPISTTSFNPQYGDDLLPNNAAVEIRNGNFHNVPILTGVLPDEGSFFITMSFPKEFGFFGEKDGRVTKQLATSVLREIFRNFTKPQTYIDFYLKDVPDDDFDLIRKRFSKAIGDTVLLCPPEYFAEKYAEKNNDVYFYYFTHRPSNTPWADWMGVAHFEEVQFVFGRPMRVPTEYTKQEIQLSARMMKMWANFAKDGNPGIVSWPKYNKEDHNYMHIGTYDFGHICQGPHLESCNLLRSYYDY